MRFCSKLLQLAAIGMRDPWTRHLSERLRSSECHAVAPRRARTWRRCPSPRAPTPRRWPRVPWRRSRPDSISVPTAMRESAASHPVGRQSVAASDAVPASVSHPVRASRRRGVPRRVHPARMARVPAALPRVASRGDAPRRRAACGAFRGRSGPWAVRPRSSSSCPVGRRYRMPSRNSYREIRPASPRWTQVRSQIVQELHRSELRDCVMAGVAAQMSYMARAHLAFAHVPARLRGVRGHGRMSPHAAKTCGAPSAAYHLEHRRMPP